MQRSETYEHLRVAEIIDELPMCREAFEDGKLSWSSLKLITRVATSDTEKSWLGFARDRSFNELRAEVRDAVRKNRSHPRTDRYGLPNLTVKFTLELTLEEKQRLETALEKAGAEIAPAMGAEKLEPREVLLYIAERFLKTDSEGTPEGREARGDSPYTILYHQCQECRQTRLMTGDGPVEVSSESVDRLGGAAAVDVLEEDIDRQNPVGLARRVKLRDGGMCQNPGCGHKGKLHAHHIEHRSHGGRTHPANEVAVCTRCHALLHAGLLRVSGDMDTGLSWQPRSERIAVDSGPDAAALMEIPMVKQSAVTDTADIKTVSGALERLGFSRREARARVERAWSEVAKDGQALEENVLLTQALRA